MDFGLDTCSKSKLNHIAHHGTSQSYEVSLVIWDHTVLPATQGRRHNFESGGYKYYCERSEQKFFLVVPPTYAILGGTTATERHTESLSDSV